jgi:hypothetical protein
VSVHADAEENGSATGDDDASVSIYLGPDSTGPAGAAR